MYSLRTALGTPSARRCGAGLFVSRTTVRLPVLYVHSAARWEGEAKLSRGPIGNTLRHGEARWPAKVTETPWPGILLRSRLVWKRVRGFRQREGVCVLTHVAGRAGSAEEFIPLTGTHVVISRFSPHVAVTFHDELNYGTKLSFKWFFGGKKLFFLKNKSQRWAASPS